MCGINGVIGSIDEFGARDLMAHMNKAIEHRGPDAGGVFAAHGIGLGHRRLSIIDLNDNARQPMFSDNGEWVLVFNGEIYNFKEIKKQLVGFSFKSESDTEVILNGFQKWGTDVFKKLDGMFALALYHVPEKKLYLARDRFGKKPLYYAQLNELFIFSSELIALQRTNLFQFSTNPNLLQEYLCYQTVQSPRTMLETVSMLPAASYSVLESNQMSIYNYWSIDDIANKYTLQGPYEKIVKQTREKIYKAVEKRLISDVPLGAFLSGGIDSSAVVAIMANVSKQQINTFNIAFGESDFDESQFAQLIAKKYNTHHHCIRISAKQFLDEIPHALQAMDHPSADGPNSYVVSKFTKAAGITVALSGLGGDEIFGGYPFYQHLLRLKWIRKWGNMPSAIKNPITAMISSRLGMDAKYKLIELSKQTDLNWQKLYGIMRRTATSVELKKAGLSDYFNLSNIGVGFPKEDRILSAISIAESKTYLQNILLRDADQMSMAHALEIRAPFMDVDLWEYMLSLPDSFKPSKPAKRLLIDAMGDDLPTEIWNRPKMGFTFPWQKWMNNELKEFCLFNLEYLLDNKILHPAYIENQIQTLNIGVENKQWYKLWNLVVLGYWMGKFNVKVNYD